MNISNGLLKKDRLQSDYERLESDNSFLSNQIKELEENLEQKRKTNKILMEKLQKSKENYADPVAEKKYLINNVDFLTTEKKRLTEKYQTVKNRLDNNLLTIDSLLKDLGFIKGEIGTLLVQIGMLEEEIPIKVRDAENLDDQITKSCASAIGELHIHMKDVEKKAKHSFYKNSQERESIRASVLTSLTINKI